MKKFTLLLALMVSNLMLTFAQNDIVLYIVDRPDWQYLCIDNQQRVIIYAQDDCGEFCWTVQGQEIWDENPLIINPQLGNKVISYNGCDFYHSFGVKYLESRVPNEFTHTVWKRQAEMDTIAAVGHDSIDYPFNYEFLWSTGETTRTIEVTEPGTYTCTISELCGTATRTFIVRDNVEIYRSGVDPATNKNKVRWNTTPQQATYVSSVKIERDGMVVGTVPYLDGEFLDAIGSENAARIYKITAIDTDGNECPLPSYQFGTFNTIISPDIANPSLMNFTWEDPFIEEGSPYSVVAYRIGRFNEATGEFIMIDQLSANVHIGKYNMDLFDGDYGIVAAVFNDAKNRDYKELAFSNRSDNEIVGIGETQAESFEVYPNPSNGVFTVKGTGTLRISNVLGQEIMAMEIDGKETVELPTGVYFVQLNGTVRKIVVE